MLAETERQPVDATAMGLRIDCPVLLTERLLMRPPMEDDVPDLVRLSNDRALASMLSTMPHPYGEAEARSFIARWGARQAGAAYALTLADTGALVGCASLGATPEGEALDLGYWVAAEHQGQGLATEAAHALVDLAFRATPVERLHAQCRVINTASRRVIQKCGYHYVGPGMARSCVAGQVAVERFLLDRKTWISLRSWPQS
jgi:RimJ/RimL family protein N-acetyltransferase